MEKIHENLGNVEETILIKVETTTNIRPMENVVAAQFKTSYNNGVAYETFYLKEIKGQTTLFHYRITSEHLL